MRKPKNSKVAEDMEVIVIDTDTDDSSGGRMLALCGQVNDASRELPTTTLAVYGETNGTSAQIVPAADDCGPCLGYDLDYQKYLAISSDYGNQYLLEDRVRDSSPLRLMYDVDNRESSRSKGRAVKNEKKKKKKNVKNRASDRLSTSKAVKDEKSRARRKSKPPTVFNVSKRLKNKDAQPKKGEALRGRKIPMAKNNVKDKLAHSSKARKKKNKERLSSLDKSYAYFLASLNNSIVIFGSDRQVKQRKDPVKWRKDPGDKQVKRKKDQVDRQVKRKKGLMCYPDRDIIISDHPFTDAPFETNKDDNVIDLEDGIKLGDRLNSSFCKKLMEILRKPYEQKEFCELHCAASLKRPLTRSRELRDGREIEYIVNNQLSPSYFEMFPDFEKQFCRCRKDLPRGLNLLRGFFFYIENIILEGSFPPWQYEKDLNKLCFDNRRCRDIVCI